MYIASLLELVKFFDRANLCYRISQIILFSIDSLLALGTFCLWYI